jgi:lysophospholipase L1-like esterase
VIVFEGINDIGMLARGKDASPEQHAALVRNIIAAYQQIIDRGHAHGMKVYGATITPFMDSDYYKPTAANEADRVAVNRWILQPGHFDGSVDFDSVLRDPSHPDHLLPAADSGDHLHPGPVGYSMLGKAVPVSWFQ